MAELPDVTPKNDAHADGGGAATHAGPALARRALGDRLIMAIWRVSFALCAGAFLWTAIDPHAARTLSGVAPELFSSADAPQHALKVAEDAVIVRVDRALWFGAAALLAAVGFLVLAASLFVGPARHRGIRSWLGLVALAALWLGFFASWPEVAWAGQRWRLGRDVAAVQPLADRLRTAWPQDDAALPGLGSFSAYPLGRVRTLLVNAADPDASHPPIMMVDRTEAGGLRFRFGGDEAGAWIEWHPPGERPTPFTDGVGAAYALVRTHALGGGWFASRYR